MPVDKAGELAGSDPDYNNRKLYDAIANGKPVSLPVLVLIVPLLQIVMFLYYCYLH